ncbi:MAG: Asp-tRNA(Asn)/Glu-tRNA(Gln) amidotransferase GatCAB subunit B [Acidobacteria bacterium]|nr:MAG: Asp-tRNA(Asn)/Glu-tRNA(Gln) amidotransferase GatCAB subunit B [Acidobacteriota bacterium]
MECEAVIGLEVHAQLLTRSKIFCSCPSQFGAPPNTNTCPVCLGFPGALPVLNREAVIMAVKAAMALGCTINPVSIFARKNYFYPDLPKGYQISQYDKPLAEHGHILLSGNGQAKKIGIKRVHMEEDAGKSIHDGFADSDRYSYIDLNRSGTPLIEIVSDPAINSPAEAYDYLTRMKVILEYLEVCDGNMEEGSLRCDANVSVRPAGERKLGTKTELKNLNSFRFLQRALEYEIARQIGVLKSGAPIEQETRLWNTAEQRTISMRSKEEAHDYRYFPEPDLPPLVVSSEWQAQIRAMMPELPEAKKQRFVEQYGIPEYDAGVLTNEDLTSKDKNPNGVESLAASNWIMGDLLRDLKEFNKGIEASPVKPREIAALIGLIDRGEISGKMAKEVFETMFREAKSPHQVIQERGLKQITDSTEIEKVIREIIANNPNAYEQYRTGKKATFGFFVGQVMKATKGQANPQLVNELLKSLLDS